MQKKNILEYLEESCERFENKVALSCSEYSLTFAELKRKAESVGSALSALGCQGSPVAVFMGREPDAVCAFMGVMYAGGFYSCIDPGMPSERSLSILDMLRARVVICNEKSKERAGIFSGRAEILCFEELCQGDIDRVGLEYIRDKAIDKDLAYVVFTSGSTGVPKGICASHRSVIDYAEALASALDFNSETVFGNQAPLYYDAPLKEILPMLTFGAKICFIPDELFLFPLPLCRFIIENGINTLCWASSAFANISALGTLDIISMQHLKTVCFGGEVLSRGEYDKWRKACPDTVFFNLYGPTEATGMSAFWRADRALAPDEQIPIGRPFPNTDIFLIDEKGHRGDCGEIYIRGSCVTFGYFARFEETYEGFVQNPLNFDYPETVYRTGDMAKINEYGELQYLGRRDARIKHMGRRIEPCEIEVCAERIQGVSAARCVYDCENKRIMLGYIGSAEPKMLLCELSEKIPRFMLPTICCRLDSLPQMSNGKTDRKKLLMLLMDKEKKCRDL